MIRVWIETASVIARAGFEALLESTALEESEAEGGLASHGTYIVLVDSPSQADVVLRDELPDGSSGSTDVPSVVLSDEPLTARLFRQGVHAILPRHAPLEQIVAALYAATAGLIAVPAEANSPMLATEILRAELLPASSAAEGESLTPRELETLEMLAEGLSNKLIAARLNISEHTAKFHVNSVFRKLDAGTRTEAVIHGLRRGLLKV